MGARPVRVPDVGLAYGPLFASETFDGRGTALGYTLIEAGAGSCR